MEKPQIVEKAFVELKNPILIEGFPSVGLVGAIATEYIASKLGMVEIGYMKSEYLPPVTIVKDGVPKAPIRFYARDNMVVVVSDTAVPAALAYGISENLVDWAVRHDVARVISLGGIAHSAQPSNNPEVFAIASTEQRMKSLVKEGFKTIKLGFLTGVFGMLMLECRERNMDSYGFLADATMDVADPGAAAAIIDKLTVHLNLKIDTKALRETSDKIREKMSALLKETKGIAEGQNSAYPSLYR